MTDWFKIHTAPSGNTLQLQGSWRIAALDDISEQLSQPVQTSSGSWTIDGSALSEIDTAGAMAALQFLRAQGVELGSVELSNCSEAQRNILLLTSSSLATPSKLREKSYFGALVALGDDTMKFLQMVVSILEFIGQTTVECLRLIRKPSGFRFRELVVQIESVGYRAIPIVVLVNFLIGIVVAYLTGVQLEQYGVNIIIVDGVSLGVTRELSPILVAIIVAGRSGSAFTAQIGTMKLNEEIDAITTLGLSPMRVLVLPRILALMIAMPLLVFAGDIAGILGGMATADLRLNVTMVTFLERLRIILPLQTVFVGLVKAPVFAFFIATIACPLGFQVEPNARSVGINTTRTVVRSIVAVILLNAAFAIIFSELGI